MNFGGAFLYKPYFHFWLLILDMLVLPQKLFVKIQGKIPPGRGEGPSYMKVPYTYPPFVIISIHNCTVFGVGDV